MSRKDKNGKCAVEFRRKVTDLVGLNDAAGLFDLSLKCVRSRRNESFLRAMRHIAAISGFHFTKWSDRRINTAAITMKGSRCSVHFNPRFVIEYVRSPDDLVFLVAHEIFHKVRGDLRRIILRREKSDCLSDNLVNICADILLNASLKRENVAAWPPALLGRLYGRDNLWAAFLCPPEFLLEASGRGERRGCAASDIRPCLDRGKREEDAITEVFSGIFAEKYPAVARIADEKERFARRAAWIYMKGWYRRNSPSFDMLFTALHRLADELFQPQCTQFARMGDCAARGRCPRYVPVLGDHEGSEDDEDGPLARWLRNNFPNQGGRGGENEEDETEVEEKQLRWWAFYEAVRKVLDPDPMNPAVNEDLFPEVGIVPFPGRKEAFLLCGGMIPVFYPNMVNARRLCDLKVHLYLDVSGSTAKSWPFLYGLVKHAGSEIGDPVYLFSNEVEAVELKDIADGRVRTTYGTDFDCLARHAIEHHFRRILVLTDGDAGIEPGLAEALGRQAEVFVILTRENPASPIIELAGGSRQEGRKWWVMPEEMAGYG